MPLTFGTAGIRGALGPGPDRMNIDTVRRVSSGLAGFLSDRLGGRPATVVVGYDARHESDTFALEVTGILSATGHRARLLPRPLPTPVLAFAVRFLDADAGVMVTASHNPASDNGLKLYLGGRLTDDVGRGAQIASPTDAEIQGWIDRVGDRAAGPAGAWTVLGDEVEEGYIRAVSGLIPPSTGEVANRRASLGIALTPLHGVGGATALAVLEAAGFTRVHPVDAQFDPDPDFPTVPFPNPEEPGAMDLVLNLAREAGATLAVALDPDADRCAWGVPIDGTWRTLTGDESGGLLGEWIAGRLQAGESLPGVVHDADTLASTVVSSRRLSAIARRHGLGSTTTLTGFKWLSRVPGLAFAYEEALGYCLAPDIVRDKDGISAALAGAEYASILGASGRTLGEALDDLDRTYGVHLTRLVAVRTPTPAEAARAVARILASPPASLGGSPVASVEDASAGLDGLSSANGVRIFTDAGTRVVVRPSGTEAKIKAYVEVIRPIVDDLVLDRQMARATMGDVEAEVRAILPR
ncbi:MAG: phospho-sugar mutase [Demequinaceae bacterium]|nr:phospho-sugar mutase [Demequinaceae bacterium]